MSQATLFDAAPDALPGFPCAWSADRSHRYTLWRTWGDVRKSGFVQFIGLNPSTATEETNDPTVRRCIGYARDWGYAGLCMTNLFSYRATDPRDMKTQATSTNAENRWWLLRIARLASSLGGVTVAAWGCHGAHQGEDERVLSLFRDIGHPLHCLKLVGGGRLPAHPLYLKKDLKPELFQ